LKYKGEDEFVFLDWGLMKNGVRTEKSAFQDMRKSAKNGTMTAAKREIIVNPASNTIVLPIFRAWNAKENGRNCVSAKFGLVLV
jgi:hypothetical protein